MHKVESALNMLSALSEMSFDVHKTSADQIEGHKERLIRIRHNTELLKGLVNCSSCEVMVQIARVSGAMSITRLQAKRALPGKDLLTKYSIYLSKVLLTIATTIDLNSVSDQLLMSALDAFHELHIYALKYQLVSQLQNSTTFFGSMPKRKGKPNYAVLKLMITVFDTLLEIEAFVEYKTIMLADYIGAIATLRYGHSAGQINLDDCDWLELQMTLNDIWATSDSVHFFYGIISMIYVRSLPEHIVNQLIDEIMQKLASPNGFKSFLKALQLWCQDGDTLEIMLLVAVKRRKGVDFQTNMCGQAFECIKSHVYENNMTVATNISIQVLHDLYANNAANKDTILALLDETWSPLSSRKTLPVGTMIMEYQKFCKLISFMTILFNARQASLPRVALSKYMAALVHFYGSLDRKHEVRDIISLLVVFILNELSAVDMSEMIIRMVVKRFPPHWLELNDSLELVRSSADSDFKFIVGDKRRVKVFNASLVLPDLLLKANFHTVTARVFLTLLRQMERLIKKINIGVLMLETDQQRFLVIADTLRSLRQFASSSALKKELEENRCIRNQLLDVAYEISWLPVPYPMTVPSYLDSITHLSRLSL